MPPIAPETPQDALGAILEPVAMTNTGNEVMAWFEEISHGKVESEVMARGTHWHFNCDGKNHYVYLVDESRREVRKDGSHGRKKRVYKWSFSDPRTTKECFAESWQWANITHPANNPACHDQKRSVRTVGEGTGHSSDVGRQS